MGKLNCNSRRGGAKTSSFARAVALALVGAVGSMAGLVAGAASAATMTQLINGPSDIRVAPLVEAHWAQGDVNGSPCYNSKTPHNYVCGCVATAAGEIMRRWQHPAAASVRRTNTCSTNGVEASFTMIGGPNVAYDWANMPFKPEGEASLSTAQREAIGTLLYDIGVAAGMDWTSNGSSTSTSIMVDQFTSVFGYSNAAIAGNPSGTGLSLEQFTQAVLPSLDAGMPVIVGIGGSNTQHSVVCDGYGYQDGDLYIHINMGSAIDSESSVGYNNAWYKFPTAVMNISTKEYTSGNGVSLWPNGEQSYLNPVVYNISPTMQKGWSIVSGRILSGETVVEGAEVVAVNASGEGVAKATSNAKGIYAIALPAGTYTLRAVDSDETKGARVSVTVVATAGTRDGATATGVVIGNQHGVDIALADIGSDFFASETPDEYLDYVQTDGSAYIDTGVIGKAGTKADIGMMWKGISDSSGSDYCFLGARNGSDGRFLLCHAYKLGWNLGYKANWNNPSSTYTPTLPANNVHYAIMTEITSSGYFNFTVNGTSGGRDTTAQGTYNSGFTMYLFANHGTESGSVANKCPSGTRCYWTRIWQVDDGGAYKLVRDFVPCKKGGRAALYDNVTRTIFYSRSGTDLIASAYTISTVAEPDAYLDYVESDGSQYVDTGVEASAGTKTEFKMRWTSAPATDWMFLGARANSNNNRFFYLYTYSKYFYYGFGSSRGYVSPNFIPATGTDYTFSVELTGDRQWNAEVSGNSSSYHHDCSSSTEALHSGINIYAFACNDNGAGVSMHSKARCYALKIWKDGVMERDFVPCRKNGEAGLYDKVSNSIFVSKGSKPLIAGPVSSVVEEPDEFLDYVESNGNQYVDTGVEGRYGTKMESGFSANSDNGNPSYLLSSFGNGTYMNFCFFGSGLNVGFGDASYNRYWNSYARDTKYAYGAGYSLTQGVSAWRSVSNGTPDEKNGTATGGTDSGVSLFAFARNNAGAADGYCSVKLYSMKIWQTDDNGTYRLLRDFVPCRKEGEPGLYDKVTKSIFYSRGTQPFIAGSLPGYPDEILDYVESTGAQYVDTGVIGRDGTKAEIDFMLTAEPTSSSIVLLGADESDPWSGNKFYLLAIRGANKKFNDGYKARYNPISDTIPSANTRYRAIADVAVGGSFKTTWNGASATHDYTSNPGPYNIGLSLYLFTNNRNGTGGALSAKARCYGLKMWQTDTNGDYQLMCDFVPCKKDGVAGLWDRVTKKIFYSKTSTALVAGNTIAKVGTPDSFVEYVESSGTQYIDTGVLGKAGTKSEATMMWLESGKDWVFLGARVDSGDTRFNLVQTYNGGFGYGYGIFRYWSGAKADAETLYTVETEYTSTSKKLVVNGNTWMNESATAFNADIPLYMFAMNYNGTASNIAKARCYSVTIDQVDVNGDYQPKRNFAPCVKGGKAALYDSVTGMIYYPQGGDLTASENEASVTSAQWIGGTVTSAADLANAANWKCWQAGLVVYGKAPVTVSEGVATLTCPVTLDVAADWSAAGVITLAAGATVDLNGHVLATAGFALAEGQTVSVLKNLPKGWKVKKSADGRTLTIVKIKGVMIIVE